MNWNKILPAFIMVLVINFSAFSQAGIKVTITDQKTKEPVPFATVVVFLNGIQSGVQNTDFDGIAVIKPLTPGKYSVKVNFLGYQPKEVKDIPVSEGKTVSLDIALSNEEGVKLDEVQVVSYVVPLVDPDTKTGNTVTREQYQAMATKDINSVASTSAGIYQKDEGSELNVRGMRSGGTQYFVDGERVIGSSAVPQSSVEQVAVILGGLPASYGDATGGVISITTRGPQSKFFGGVEAISSQLTDAFGYNFLGFSVGGPLISKKDTATGAKKAILGFILSGQGTVEKDPDPSAVGVYRVKSDKLSSLEAEPLRPSVTGIGVNRNAEFLTLNDLENIKARENVASRSFVVNGKLDFKPTNNLNLTLGASYDYNTNHGFIYEYSMLNPVNNPQTISSTFRTYARITQKFGNASSKDEKSSSNIKNAFFTAQIGYTSTKSTTQDDTHKKNLFDYGYIGKFEQLRSPTYVYQTRTINDGAGNFVPVSGFFQNGFQDIQLTYSPGTINPLGTNYTDQVYSFLNNDVTNYFDIQQNLGLFNGDRPLDIYNLYACTGRQYNGWGTNNQTQFRGTASFSADIKNHAIQIGLEYDQRTTRSYNISPIGLWTRMRQLVNLHTTELDTTNPIFNAQLSGSVPYYDYNRKYNAGLQTAFSKNLLNALNLPENYNGWIDIDNMAPSTFNINMFSAEDLMLSGAAPIVSYYGYDHQGNITKNSITNPATYLNERDKQGYRTYAQGAFRPVYMAGYIQDKFDFKDMKFNVGVRVDRYDANQQVLKDKYLFKEAKTIAEVNNLGDHPNSLPSNSVVYVDDPANPTKIVGYRNGDVWYNSAGSEISDPIVLAQATTNGTIAPYLLNSTSSTVFEASAFKDYKPQINWMPRFAFSFPISDVANFFAHYDLLVQRPTQFQRIDLTDYEFIFNNTGAPLNNPDLKPTKTTDYELGFTQILNEKKNSALKITAYYRENRDMVNVIRVSQAYPKTYLTYSNIDFGTVKGFQLEYDLRRTGGVSLTANYTLQFADGSGSSAQGGYNLANSGFPNLRVTLPLSFDQRHTFTTTFDYRFGDGTDYRGPVITTKSGKTLQIFKNVGANFVVRAGSGTPYTRQSTASAEAIGGGNKGSIVGQVNGSYMPWQFRTDLRIDKNFELEWGKKEGDNKKKANLNVYLQVLNLFNRQNVVGVYAYTGNPNDDGYLASPFSQQNINAQNSPIAFTTLYNVKVNNPNNYSRPRVIRVGLQLDF
ncbi:MAG: TonB-dependent receptor domain-containing protein [Bacteroidota bacterium]|jgi:hypothetical protein